MKRYAFVDEALEPDEHGRWVKFEDVQVLLAELNLLRGEQLRRGWIPVEEREPPKDGTASLAFFPQFGGYVADQRMKPIYWTGEAWQVSISGHNTYDKFTHWMPLPSAP